MQEKHVPEELEHYLKAKLGDQKSREVVGYADQLRSQGKSPDEISNALKLKYQDLWDDVVADVIRAVRCCNHLFVT